MGLYRRRAMILTCYDVAILLPETMFFHTQFYIINSFMIGRLVACFKYYKSYFSYYSVISHEYSCLKAIANSSNYHIFNTFPNLDF